MNFEVNPLDWTTNLGGFIMAKLTYEDKKEIVRLYDEEYYGYLSIAKMYKVREATISDIILKYHLHGEALLLGIYRAAWLFHGRFRAYWCLCNQTAVKHIRLCL